MIDLTTKDTKNHEKNIGIQHRLSQIGTEVKNKGKKKKDIGHEFHRLTLKDKD